MVSPHPFPPAFEYTNMPPPINVGDNPMYMAADKVPSTGPPSSQNTLSRQFMNPLYDYEEDEGTTASSLTHLTLNTISSHSAGDTTVMTNPSAKRWTTTHVEDTIKHAAIS